MPISSLRFCRSLSLAAATDVTSFSSIGSLVFLQPSLRNSAKRTGNPQFFPPPLSHGLKAPPLWTSS
jgi:hypothetical protein